MLTFSLLNGLYLGGILSVLAMSIGTALTVSLLAILAVTAKGAAVRFAGVGSRRAAVVGHGFEIGGALMVMVLGLILLIACASGLIVAPLLIAGAQPEDEEEGEHGQHGEDGGKPGRAVAEIQHHLRHEIEDEAGAAHDQEGGE